jgi:hypothetical protein
MNLTPQERVLIVAFRVEAYVATQKRLWKKACKVMASELPAPLRRRLLASATSPADVWEFDVSLLRKSPIRILLLSLTVPTDSLYLRLHTRSLVPRSWRIHFCQEALCGDGDNDNIHGSGLGPLSLGSLPP